MAVETRRIDTHCERAQQISDVEFRYTWHFSHDDFYSRISGVGEALLSPIFSTGFNNELRWCMKMYPKGIDECNKHNVSLYVCFVPSTKNVRVQAKFRLSILDESNVIVVVKESSGIHTFVSGTPAKSSGFNNYMKQDRVTYDIFHVYYNCKIVCELKDVLVISDVTIPEHRFLDNLGTLFESKKFSDITLIISEEEFQAHKVILALYSPVFSAMFEHEMTERMHNEVKISDITPEVFNEMLRFMYTGEVQGIEKIADLLLVVADKYDVERLKAMCEDALCKNINVENAADTLILADEHNADQLKPRVLKFIASCTTDVMATPGFQSMAQSHPHLLVEMLHVLAASGGQKA